MSRPRLGQRNTWEKQKQLAIEVLLRALVKLQMKVSLPRSEVLLNRQLYICLQEANHDLWVSSRGKKGFEYLPVSEGKNPPAIDDEERAKREDKVPDFFLCSFQDHVEIIRTGNVLSGQKYLPAECKCLGKTRKSGWKLNKNYIDNGVLRFIKEDFGYAKDQDLGVMIGYVQDMELADILQEVNNYSYTVQPPTTQLNLSVQGWQQGGISFLDHIVNRNFQVSPFPLQHYWIDIRAYYSNEQSQQTNQLADNAILEQLSFSLEVMGSEQFLG